MLLGGHVEINEAEVHIGEHHGERLGQPLGCCVGGGCRAKVACQRAAHCVATEAAPTYSGDRIVNGPR